MKLQNIKIYHFHSFATRLTVLITLVVMLVFVIVIGIYYSVSKTELLNETITQAHYRLTCMKNDIEKPLIQTETALIAHEQAVRQCLQTPDSLANVLVDILRQNEVLTSCGIAFTANYFPEKGEYFMLYAIRENKQIRVMQIGSADYNYFGQDWFIIPQRLKKNFWSEPYYDQGAGNIVMTTFSHPLKDKNDKVFAMMGADISLDKLTFYVKNLKSFTKSSNTFLISRNGYFLTHNEADHIMNETLLTDAYDLSNKKYAKVGREMLAGKTGTAEISYNSTPSYAFYTSIPINGWSLCCVSPVDDILTGLQNITRLIVLLFIFGLVLVLLMLHWVVRKLTEPVVGFAQAAHEFAEGHFNAFLPKVITHDEIRLLYDSLDHMRVSLVDYIEQLKQTTISKERIEQELNIAHDIQMGILPQIFPDFPERNDIDLFASVNPAKEVGGDLYDFFIRDSKVFFAVGDVSGKGVPASLFMAITSSMFRTLLQIQSTPEGVLTAMNTSLAAKNEMNMFVTMVVGVLDLNTGVLNICNAGHNPPLIIQPDEEVKYMTLKRNIPIGLFGDFVYHPDEYVLQPNARMIIYTDGVTEAENNEKELYGEERLIRIITQNRTLDVRELNHCISEDISNHVQGAVQSDDITQMEIHFKPNFKTNIDNSQK